MNTKKFKGVHNLPRMGALSMKQAGTAEIHGRGAYGGT
ncbi:MAG: hypothetical protein JWL69_2675 [Phycisphaerales bacterium]|jgi:hypothetical protein|nr:hypothetical protein [Phycisphaerales bacterium]